MSQNYAPELELGTDASDPLSTVLLSQRDLSLRVPINFVTNAGVSLSAACFSQRRYEDDESADCLSNLLAVGFRRFEIDLYWDEDRRVWSFCPVEIPDVLLDTPSPLATTRASSVTGSSASRAESTRSASPSLSTGTGINPRQLSTDASPSSTSTDTSIGTSLGTATPSKSAPPESPDVPSVNVGAFVCTTTINLSVFTSQILDYIQQTENTLGARLLYVFFNIHATSSPTFLSQPAAKPSSLPDEDELIGSLFSSNLSEYIYTPAQLHSDRADLNSSWYRVDAKYLPINGYYSTELNENNILSTEDGWPSEAYIEFSRSRRMLLGWGTVDPQMEDYNFTGDADTVFDKGYIANLQGDVVASGDGQLTNGCFLRDGEADLSQVNSSWAFASSVGSFQYPTAPLSDTSALISLTRNLTSCGISPVLNHTLLGTTASQNVTSYHSFTNATIWSWLPAEPRNTSGFPNERCASTSPLGLWSVTDCTTSLPAACRSPSQPYNWTLTTRSTTYSSVSSSCPPPYIFAVPRTALENAYLTQRIRNDDRINRKDDRRIWIDYNAIDQGSCWVTGGPNATCPYADLQGREEVERRNFRIILAASIAIFVIAALALFVECAGNRSVSKKGKRRERRAARNGVAYEGVPS